MLRLSIKTSTTFPTSSDSRSDDMSISCGSTKQATVATSGIWCGVSGYLTMWHLNLRLALFVDNEAVPLFSIHTSYNWCNNSILYIFTQFVLLCCIKVTAELSVNWSTLEALFCIMINVLCFHCNKEANMVVEVGMEWNEVPVPSRWAAITASQTLMANIRWYIRAQVFSLLSMVL